jgi:small-conductance mechanosensitive channel
MNDWIAAAIAAGAGLVLGVFFGRLAQNFLAREGRPDILRASARPMGSVVFSALLVAGLTTALGFVNKEARDQIPQDLVDYIPSLLSAAIVLIGANVLAQLVQTTLERTTARMPGDAARNVSNAARLTILTFGAILAAAQLGVDTTIINIAVAAVLFSLGLGAALMVGLGSRAVAGEVAAGRAVRRLVSPGDHIVAGDISGTVLDIQSVAVEVEAADGSVLLPHSHILGHDVAVRRGTPADTEGSE